MKICPLRPFARPWLELGDIVRFLATREIGIVLDDGEHYLVGVVHRVLHPALGVVEARRDELELLR